MTLVNKVNKMKISYLIKAQKNHWSAWGIKDEKRILRFYHKRKLRWFFEKPFFKNAK